jgi:hypothetical protein
MSINEDGSGGFFRGAWGQCVGRWVFNLCESGKLRRKINEFYKKSVSLLFTSGPDCAGHRRGYWNGYNGQGKAT